MHEMFGPPPGHGTSRLVEKGQFPGALREVVRSASRGGSSCSRLDVAVGYLSAEGWEAAGLRDLYENDWACMGARILVGVMPAPGPSGPLSGDRTAAAFAEWLRRHYHDGALEVRLASRSDRGLLHAKAAVSVCTDEGLEKPVSMVLGSANLTAGGMSRNRELGMVIYGLKAQDAADWFGQEWDCAQDCVPELLEMYEAAAHLSDPHLVFLRALWQQYHREIEAEMRMRLRLKSLQLTEFQTSGVRRAKRIMDRTGGVVLADEVGLGKTWMAGALIEDCAIRGGQVLVLCPAALKGMWHQFLKSNGLSWDTDVVSDDTLASRYKNGGEVAKGLTFADLADQYELVVVDEAHRLRNPESGRSEALWAFLDQCSEGRTPRVMLLTATPVNNSVMDMYWLLQLYGADAPDLRAAARGETLYQLFWRFHSESSSEAGRSGNSTTSRVRDVLDSAVVRRTRSFVERHYPADDLDEEFRFPSPRLHTISYKLGPRHHELFEQVVAGLAPDGQLKLAVYSPESYAEGGSSGRSPNALVRSMLLKRYESSPVAFANTLKAISDKCNEVLIGNGGRAVSAADPGALGDVAEDLLDDGEGPIQVCLNGRQMAKFRADVQSDKNILDGWRADSESLEDDPCLDSVVRDIADIAESSDGSSEYERACRRKVMVFTSYRDTAKYVYDRLCREARFAAISRSSLSVYRNRVGMVTRDMSEKDVREVLGKFSPTTMNGAVGDLGSIDVLVCTDAFSEGMNLQQARHVINYDLPWNPMRLVQRHGRIDRLGSSHSEVVFRSVFPDEGLDERLGLETRLRAKIEEASESIGAPLILEGYRSADVSFDDARRVVEALHGQDLTGVTSVLGPGPDSDADGLRERLIEEMHNSLEEKLSDVPVGSGAVMYASVESPMAVFCSVMRSGEDSQTEMRLVSLEDCRVVSSDVEKCLAVFDTSPDGALEVLDEGLRDKTAQAWAASVQDIVASSRPEPAARLAAQQHELLGMLDGQKKAAAALRSAKLDKIRIKKLMAVAEDPDRGPQHASRMVLNHIGEYPESENDAVSLVCWSVVLPTTYIGEGDSNIPTAAG